MIDLFKNEINFLKSSWQNLLGRPTVVIVIKKLHYGIYYLISIQKNNNMCLLITK